MGIALERNANAELESTGLAARERPRTGADACEVSSGVADRPWRSRQRPIQRTRRVCLVEDVEAGCARLNRQPLANLPSPSEPNGRCLEQWGGFLARRTRIHGLSHSPECSYLV